MNLRSQVEWALHCCALLSLLAPGSYLSTKALAEFHGIPKDYLSKALQALSNAQLVHTTLGPTGGYRLARSENDVTVIEIVEAVEGKASTFACSNIRENNPCRPKGYCDTEPCAVAKVMWRADQAWRDALAGVRLADICQSIAEDNPEELLRETILWVNRRTGRKQ